MEPEQNPYSAPHLVADDEHPMADLRRRLHREFLGVVVVFTIIGLICVVGLWLS